MRVDFSGMSLKEKVLQTFIVTIREINKHGGPKVFFEKYPVGGMYYWDNPATEGTIEMGTALNRARMAECRKASKIPLFVCADGTRLRGQEFDVDLAAISAIDTEEAAYEYGKVLGMQMNEHGVDWILGPVADMLIDHTMPLFGWCDDADTVIKMVGAMIRGIQDQGVCATIKHFPGNGTCNLNMHFGPGRNVMDFDEWMNTYGKIYKSAFEQGVLSVMTTHVTLESYDKEMHEGYYPIATFSEKLTIGLVKEKLGLQGAVVTDALIMGGMATGNLIEETVMAFKCGADFLLWPPIEAADRIVELLESGEIPMSRLEDALTRIDKMRTFRENALQEHVMDTPDVKYVNAANRKFINDGMCLLRNSRNIIPLSQESVRKILIIDVTKEGKKSSYLLQEELKKRGFVSDVKRDIYDVPSLVCWQDDLDELTAQYDRVIFNIDTPYSTAWSVPFMLLWASHLVDKNKKIFINYGSPFFAPTYLPEEPTFVEVNGEANEYSIKVLVDKLLGESEFVGKNRLKKKMSEIRIEGN